MTPELISILMPVKNSSAFLSDCLDSILNQTEKNWELIAVDDHSTDSCADILKNYSQQDTRIHYYSNTGSGIINALQLAFSKSSGEFITRMDSDDLMEAIKLNALKDKLQKAGKGHLAVGLVNYFSETSLGNGYKKYANWLNDLTINANNFSDIYKECVIPSPNWMLYRSDLIACSAFDSEDYPEDYDLCFRMYAANFKVLPLKKITHHWRDYSTRSSRTDEHYSDNRFLDLKLTYFVKLDWNKEELLILWGAGKKGKKIAQFLIDKKIDFIWMTNNSKKIGVNIYGKIIQSEANLSQFPRAQIIVAVAKEGEKNAIKKKITLSASQTRPFYFC